MTNDSNDSSEKSPVLDPDAKASSEKQAEPKAEGADAGAGFSHRPHPDPHIDFSGFVLSLAQTALIDLGVAPHPETNTVTKNIVQARNTIDILGLLQEKTAGNLTEEESSLLNGVLYQLRLSFVEAK